MLAGVVIERLDEGNVDFAEAVDGAWVEAAEAEANTLGQKVLPNDWTSGNTHQSPSTTEDLNALLLTLVIRKGAGRFRQAIRHRLLDCSSIRSCTLAGIVRSRTAGLSNGSSETAELESNVRAKMTDITQGQRTEQLGRSATDCEQTAVAVISKKSEERPIMVADIPDPIAFC